MQRQVVAVRMQPARDRRAEAAGAAGDQGDGTGGRSWALMRSFRLSCRHCRCICRPCPHRRNTKPSPRPTPTRSPTASACAAASRNRSTPRAARSRSRASWSWPLRAGAGLLQRGRDQVRRGRRLRHRAGTRAVVRRLRRRQPRAGAAAARAAGGLRRARRRQRRVRGSRAQEAARRWMRCPRATRSSNPAPTCANASANACANALNPLLFDLVEWLDAPPQDAWNGEQYQRLKQAGRIAVGKSYFCNGLQEGGGVGCRKARGWGFFLLPCVIVGSNARRIVVGQRCAAAEVVWVGFISTDLSHKRSRYSSLNAATSAVFSAAFISSHVGARERWSLPSPFNAPMVLPSDENWMLIESGCLRLPV